ncbi:MFS transporter [Actinocatenispora thailandica]|uniref:MFS transporter n=1 Tax=Actinocatenispora thailandica TaxID=227318 RepID=UPI0031DC0B6B
MRRDRLGASGVFVVHGAVTGTFATRVPWLADHVGVGTGQLGLALLFPAIGAIGAMSFTGRLLHRYDGRRVTRVLLGCWCAALLLPALAPNLPALCAALLIYGAASGMADVAMNAEAVAVEQAVGRSIMSGLHGLWSVGGLAASGVGVLAAALNVDGRLHFAVLAAVLLVLGQFAARLLPPVRPRPDAVEPPAFALPPRPVLLLGLLGFCAVFGEGAGSDWAAKYLTDVAHAPQGVAAGAYTGFAFAMAAGRLVGDGVVNRIGVVGTVRMGGILAAAGAVLVAVSRQAAPGILGFALLGVGVSVVVPLTFTAAGSATSHPGHAIAGVATISYGAGFAAPAVIGGIAGASSLSVSFVVVAVLTGLIAVGATRFAPRRR